MKKLFILLSLTVGPMAFTADYTCSVKIQENYEKKGLRDVKSCGRVTLEKGKDVKELPDCDVAIGDLYAGPESHYIELYEVKEKMKDGEVGFITGRSASVEFEGEPKTIKLELHTPVTFSWAGVIEELIVAECKLLDNSL